MKKCVRCKVALPLEAFSKNHRKFDGLQSECKTCRRNMNREYRRSNPHAKAKAPALSEKQKQLFWPKVDMTGDCWIWTAGKLPSGYGRYLNHFAHRVAYEITHGPIPDGLHVCHKCDNPSCCNPAHLFAGTAKDNMQDRERKGRGKGSVNIQKAIAKRRSDYPLRLTLPQIVDICQRDLSQRGAMVALAREYGIDHSLVRRIRAALKPA